MNNPDQKKKNYIQFLVKIVNKFLLTLLLGNYIMSLTIFKQIRFKDFDEEEYIITRVIERRCWWKFSMKGLWKVASEL